MKCGYQPGAICEDVTSTLWAAGRDSHTGCSMPPTSDLPPVSPPSLKTLWQTPRFPASPTLQGEWTLSSPLDHLNTSNPCARRCPMNGTDSSAWLWVGKLQAKTQPSPCAQKPESEWMHICSCQNEARPWDTGMHSLLVRGAKFQDCFSCFWNVPYMEENLFSLP